MAAWAGEERTTSGVDGCAPYDAFVARVQFGRSRRGGSDQGVSMYRSGSSAAGRDMFTQGPCRPSRPDAHPSDRLLETPRRFALATGQCGVPARMSDIPDEDHVKLRATLLPEELAAGSDDPQRQAEVILEESQERTDDPDGTGAESVQTSTPGDRPS